MSRSLREIFSMLETSPYTLSDASSSDGTSSGASGLGIPEPGLSGFFDASPAVGELFAMSQTGTAAGKAGQPNQEDVAVIDGFYSSTGINFSCLPASACRLHELSVNAFDALVHAWMSELLLEGELLRFGRKVLAAGSRTDAERIASNRSDGDVRLILDTANKVWHEIDRFRGLLRFSPDAQGRYIAFCGPDHFILPAMGGHFSQRFGSVPWAIVDEKRSLCLSCFSGSPPELFALQSVFPENSNKSPGKDQWEALWLNYHKTINNESRNNPALQRQFMPKRYWKNLPEMQFANR